MRSSKRAATTKTIVGLSNPLGNVGACLALADEYAKIGAELIEVMPPTPDPAVWITNSAR